MARTFNPSATIEPPHSTEAEQQILGALLNNNDLIDKVSDVLDVEAFYDPVHGMIYGLIRDRVDNGMIASPVTLKPAVAADENLAELGGPTYLVNLSGAAVSSFAIRDYAEMVVDLSAKRSLLEQFQDATLRISDGKEPATVIAGSVETSAGAIMSKSSIKPLIRTHLSSMMGALTRINDAYMGVVEPGVSTGLAQLDNVLGFMRPGNMILLAGRPSMGKTSVAQNIAFAAAMSKVGVFFGSLEMTGEELGTRFISKGLAANGINIPYSRMIKGQLSEDEMRHVAGEADRQKSLPLFVGERDVREASRLRSAVRRARQQLEDTDTPLGLVVIDYVQKIESKKATNGYDKASAASDLCKDLAMDLGVPVVALAQLSRAVESRDVQTPMLSDLRDTGKLEEDADVVVFTYREAYYLQRQIDAQNGSDVEAEADLRYAMERCKNNIDLIVAKQRSGATGTVRAYIEPGLCHVTQDRSYQDDHLI
jgi:replicative DNA helicase